MSKLTLKEFRKYLYSQSREELVLELEKIYKLYPEIQIYFQTLLLPSGGDEQFAKVADLIREEFDPKGRPKSPDLRGIKKAISGFTKFQPNPDQLGKLYSQLAFGLMNFMEEYGAQEWYYMPFYNTTKNFLLFVSRHCLQNKFEEDARKLVEYERNYGSDLPDIYYQNFNKIIKKK